MSDNMMWALVKEKPEAGLWMKRVPIPEVGPNDVKIKIHKTAICGTDVHIYQWNEWAQHTIPVGLTAGHEYVGEVVEVGPGVQGFKIGDLVSGEGHITCGKCRNCLEGHKENCKDAKGVGVNRNGAFAEYLVIPSSNVWPCNPNIPEEMYAIFDPFGNATHTALSYDMLGEDVLNTDAGAIGIMAVAIAKFSGARHVVVTDLNQYRLDLATKLDIVVRGGSWFNYGETRLGQGRDNAKEFLKANPEIAQEIETKVRENADKLLKTTKTAGKKPMRAGSVLAMM